MVRNNTLHQLKLNEPKGAKYAQPSLQASTSIGIFPVWPLPNRPVYILWLPPVRPGAKSNSAIKLRQEMTPQQRARITDPNSIYKRVKAYLGERESDETPRKPKTIDRTRSRA